MSKKFSLLDRLLSCRHAARGLRTLVTEEHNARLHVAAAIMAVTLGIVLKISATEWLFICFAIGIVFIAESLNTALENLADHVSPEENELVRKAKDLGALAVMTAAVMAVVTGGIVFLPKLW